MSSILRNKLAQKQKLTEAIKSIDEKHIKLASWEDNWDGLIAEQLELEGKSTESERQETDRMSSPWKRDVLEAREDVHGRIVAWTNKMRDTAARMLEIVDKEKELHRQEVEAKKQEKFAKFLEKKKRLMAEGNPKPLDT